MESKYLLSLILFVSMVIYGESKNCPEKFEVLGNHSACLEPSSSFVRGGVSEEDEDEIVILHNKIRSDVYPVANDMQRMYWDDELAEVAQAWASQCVHGSDEPNNRYIPGKYTVGQNWGVGYSTWAAVIAGWESTKTYFQYGITDDPTYFANYTQMIWSKSAKVGCGYAECSDTRGYFFCNYSPMGNVVDVSEPYAATGTSKTYDCGGKVCGNRGELDLSTCTCKCLKDYVGATCSLNCTARDNGEVCYGGAVACDNMGIPLVCPWTCNHCPYSGIGYSSKATAPSGKSMVTLIVGLLSWRFLVAA